MKRLIVAKNVKYGASKASATTETAVTPDLLRDGAIAFYTHNANKPVLLSKTAVTGTGIVNQAQFAEKQIQLAVGTETGVLLAPIMDVKAIDVKSAAFAAPVKKVSTVTFTLAGTPTVRTATKVTISQQDKDNFWYQKSYTVQGVFTTAELLCDALRAAIAEDPSSKVVASGTTTLILTDKDFNSPVEVGVDSEHATFVTALTTPFSRGAGLGALLQGSFERGYRAYLGNHGGERDAVVPKFPNKIEAINYDVYVITFANAQHPKGAIGNVFNVSNEILVLFPNGVGGTAGDNQLIFEQLLEDLDVPIARLKANP
jgi:hypothetical protein